MSLSTILVSEIMIRDVKQAKDSEPVLYAIGLMAKHKISSVVIVDERNKPVGILTEKDAIRIVSERERPLMLRLGSVMSSPLVTVSSASSLSTVLNLMSSKNINHLPVVENEKLVGIITEKDIFKHVLRNIQSIQEIAGASQIPKQLIERFEFEMVGMGVWPEPHRT
ncbi:MAG: CBS domain-containing protein [Candidatus Nitrosomirales archaeon]|jgi:CBS domain-containing protein